MLAGYLGFAQSRRPLAGLCFSVTPGMPDQRIRLVKNTIPPGASACASSFDSHEPGKNVTMTSVFPRSWVEQFDSRPRATEDFPSSEFVGPASRERLGRLLSFGAVGPNNLHPALANCDEPPQNIRAGRTLRRWADPLYRAIRFAPAPRRSQSGRAYRGPVGHVPGRLPLHRRRR